MLIVDTREPRFEDPDFTRAYLSRGDYAIIRKDGKCAALIERKTFSDYVASMKDKRIRSIETKLLGIAEKTYVLLEGVHELDAMCHGISFRSVLKSCARLEREHNIVILRSQSFQGSRDLIKALVNDFEEDFSVATIPDILQQAVKKNPYEYAVEFLAESMKGVGELTAELILAHGSLQDHLTMKEEVVMPKTLNKLQREQYRAMFSDEHSCDVLHHKDLRYLIGTRLANTPRFKDMTLKQLYQAWPGDDEKELKEKIACFMNARKTTDWGKLALAGN